MPRGCPSHQGKHIKSSQNWPLSVRPLQIRMGDAFLKGNRRGACDVAIDNMHVGRWFRCAAKVRAPSHKQGVLVPFYLDLVKYKRIQAMGCTGP